MRKLDFTPDEIDMMATGLSGWIADLKNSKFGEVRRGIDADLAKDEIDLLQEWIDLFERIRVWQYKINYGNWNALGPYTPVDWSKHPLIKQKRKT